MRILLFIISFLLVSSSFGCTCAVVQGYMDSSIVKSKNYEIFLGTIISRRSIKIEDRKFYQFKIKVNENFTLTTDEKFIKVMTASHPGACGYRFRVGKNYLITTGKYSSKVGMRRTSICLRNVQKKWAEDEIEFVRDFVENSR